MRTIFHQVTKRIQLVVLGVTLVAGSVFAYMPPLAAASPPLIVKHQFAANANGFDVVSGGTWSVANGEYGVTNPAVAEVGNGNISIAATPLTGAWNIELDATATSAPGGYSIIYDYSDPQNYSYVRYTTQANDLFSQGFFRVQAGSVSQTASFNSAVAVGSKLVIKIKYDGSKVKAYRGTTYLNGVTQTVRNGAFTGVATTSSAANFDNYALYGTVAAQPIQPLPQVLPTPPTQPPAAPTTCSMQPVRTVNVATTAELNTALATAQPGDLINLADGVYVDNFVITASGTAEQPIKLVGSAAAVLDAGNVNGSYVLHLDHANYWCISGVSVTNGNKGIVGDFTNNTIFDNLNVHDVGDEAIHLRSCSTNNIVQNSHIHHTGLRRASFGEGVYIGTAESNWGLYNYCTTGNPDPSHYNRILGNNFDNTAAEAIDIKEGTQGGLIQGNHFDGIGMVGDNHADAWVDIKGGYYTVRDNVGVTSGPSSVVDGFQTHVVFNQMDSTLSGRGNIFANNSLNVNGSGYGIRVDLSNGGTALVTCDNIAQNAALGLSNLGCRP